MRGRLSGGRHLHHRHQPATLSAARLKGTVMSLTMTPAAERFIRRMMRFESHPHGGFRLEVSPGGCAGLTAEFAPAPAPRRGEQAGAGSRINMFLCTETRILLDQVTLDFDDTATQTGFVFNDPKQSACGCTTG